MQNLLKNIEVTLLTQDTTGTGSTDADIAIPVDMQGFVGCCFVAETWSTQLASGTATLTIKEGATTSAFVSLAVGGASAYTTAAASTSAELIIVDVFRPKDRYLQANVDAITGDVYSVKAIKYRGRKTPITQDTDDVPSNAVATVATPTT